MRTKSSRKHPAPSQDTSTSERPEPGRSGAGRSVWHRLQRLGRQLDMAGLLAERLESHWQRWWVPALLLSFPVLLLIIASLITILR